VIDTIGLNSKSYVDNYRTPHTEKLHVVERWRLVDDMTLEVVFTVDDPDTFNASWTASYRFPPDSAAGELRGSLRREQ
jgi:hypothetical protein